MNNGLGINFFRYIKEEDDNKWCQVFAKIPFDDEEIEQKGALFGVVRFTKTEEWSEIDMELTGWVDSYFNSLEERVDMANFCGQYKEKYPESEFLWTWIVKVNNVRQLKVCAKGETSFFVLRSGKEINLGRSLDSEKVLSGTLLESDKLLFGLGVAKSEEEMEKATNEECSGFLKIEVNHQERAAVFEIEENTEEILPEKEETIKKEEAPIATDRYLIKPNLWQKTLTIFKRRDLSLSNGENRDKRKKVAVLMGVVFVVLLGVSLFLGQAKRSGLERDKKWQEFAQPIEKVTVEAIGVAKINQTGAKKMIEDIKEKFNLGKNNFEDKEKLAELEKKINEAWTLVSGEINTQMIEVLNLDLIRAGVNANRMSYSGDSLLSIISGESGVVMNGDAKTKSIKVVAGKGAGLGWIDAVSSGEKTYVLTKGGIFVAGNETNSVIFDSAVSLPVSMSIFGANVYVLEKNNKEIFKYPISETVFGERQRWLKEGQSISGSPVDMDIDIDIWVLEEGGLIEKFRRGTKETLNISGLELGGDYSKITVEPEGKRFGLLSNKLSTVAICAKETGVCDKQLKNSKFSQAKDIVFDKEGNLYILYSGSVEMVN